jgi:hypothetical protein
MARRKNAPSEPNCSMPPKPGQLADTAPPGLFRRAYERFIRLRGCPREIARGFAVGIFVGLTPTMGAQMLIAVPLAALVKANKVAAAAGVWITNPVTAAFIYGLTYVVGSRITGLSGRLASGFADQMTLMEIVARAPHVFWTLTVGGIVMGIPLAAAGYYLSLVAVTRYRDGIQQKIAVGKEKLIQRSRSRRKKKKSTP